MNKKKFLVTLVIVLVVLTAAFALLKEDKVEIGTYLHSSLNPSYHSSIGQRLLSENVYETLVTYNEYGELKPLLAEDWELKNEDKGVFRFYLKEDVKFHNGRELTSEDVVDSLNNSMNTESRFKNAVFNIEEFDIVDKHTVDIEFPNSRVRNIYSLAHPSASILSLEEKESLDEVGGVGTGPYKILDSSEDIVIGEFEKYYREVETFGEVSINIIQDDENKKLDFDIVHGRVFEEESEKLEEYEIAKYPGNSIYLLALDLKQKPFFDKQLRQHISGIIDRKSISEKAGIRYEPLYSHFPSFHKNYMPVFKNMSKIGFEDNYSTELSVQNYSQDIQIAKKLMEQVNTKSNLTFTKEKYEFRHFISNYDYFNSYITELSSSFYYPGLCFILDSEGSDSAGINFENEEFDDLVYRKRYEHSSEDRQDIFEEIQEKMAEEKPVIPLLESRHIVGLSNKVNQEDIHVTPMGSLVLKNKGDY